MRAQNMNTKLTTLICDTPGKHFKILFILDSA